jgi:serine protease Do
MPKIVKEHFIARPGYVNYYFNQVERDRVWKALVARGDYGAPDAVWTIEGETGIGEPFKFEISDTEASIQLPAGQSRIELAEGLSGRLEPPGSGGLLLALAMWRRMLVEGPEKFGYVYYLGTAPVAGHEGLLDVLAATHDDIECRFLFDPADGYLVAMELYPAEDVDPCELYFSEFQEVDGRMMPARIEARHGDGFANLYEVKAEEKAEEKAEGKRQKAEG